MKSRAHSVSTGHKATVVQAAQMPTKQGARGNATDVATEEREKLLWFFVMG